MWLDAFIKPNSGNMQKSGVLGVLGVPAPRKANEYKGLAENQIRNTANVPGVLGVPEVDAGTPRTPRNTDIKTRCSDSEAPRKASLHAGLAFSGTPRTPRTPEKHNEPEIYRNLQLFQFDLVQQEIARGYPEEELRRVNNITWHLMRVSGFQFDEAIKAAGKWVASQPMHEDEKHFDDVMELFKELTQ